MRVAYSVKEPSCDVANEFLNAAIVMMNPAGSSCNEDTGREAQDMANTLGGVVIAADRPISHAPWPSNELITALRDRPILVMDGIAKAIAKETAHYDKIYVVGRSAGATGGMELTLTEQLANIDKSYYWEPAGSDDITENGSKEYRNRLKNQKKLEKADHAQAEGSGELKLLYPNNDAASLSPLRKARRMASMVALNPLDLIYNRNHYNQLLVPGYVGRIVFDMGIRTHIDNAEFSMVLPQDAEARDQALKVYDDLQQRSDSLFTHGVILNKVHRSFDNRPAFVEQVAEFIAA